MFHTSSTGTLLAFIPGMPGSNITWYLDADVLFLTSKVNKAIPVTGCGGPWSCESSRLQHCLDNMFTDGSEVVSLKRCRGVNLREDS
jgi:hypothetical protein